MEARPIMDPFAANQSPVASDTVLIEEYPEPVARAWQRVLIASPLPSFHHRQLLVAAETLAYYLGAVAIAAYEQYQAEGGTPDPALNRSLRNLRRPTFGQWLGWVRSALAAVPAEDSLLPGLAAAYDAPDTGMLLLGYEGLRAMMVVQLGYSGEYGAREAATPRLLLELINQYQLRRANHPLPPDSGFDEMGAVSVMAPGLRAALGRLSLLAAYPLLGLVRTPAGTVEVLRLQGLSPARSSVELDPEAAAPGTLLLANPDELPMLVLDPWLIYAECPECGQVQVAAFQRREGELLHYRGLECEHTWGRSSELRLVEAEVGDASLAAGGEPGEPGWVPDVAGLPVEQVTDAQAALFAALEAESAALTAERRARLAAADAAPAPTEDDIPASTDPPDVYLDLLEQRAAGGLTLDQLQELDEQRAAAAERRRREQPDTETR
jgi:hypothetical protein